MAESDVAVSDDVQADLDFAQGFDSAPPPPAQPAQGEPAPEAKAPDPKPIKAEKKDDPAPPAPTPAPAAPEYVQITKEEHANFLAAAAKTAGFEAQLAKAFGTIGNLKQVVDKLQSQTPAGEKVEVPKVALAKLRESFPEVADLLEGDLAEALKGVRGTGSDEKPEPVIDQAALTAAAKAIDTQRQIEALEDNHPNWREIVGVDDEGKHDPNNPFRKWLATQPAEYQTKINETHSAIVISNAIGKFQASVKVAEAPSAQTAPKAAARKDRIQAAVQPKGDGGQPPPPKTADDDFQAGFSSG